MGTQGMRNEEVVSEVKQRLYKTKCPWLLVFDNVYVAGADVGRGSEGEKTREKDNNRRERQVERAIRKESRGSSLCCACLLPLEER